ncbi:MAG: TIR domain-containing protein [Flavobacteriaceae bacterium]
MSRKINILVLYTWEDKDIKPHLLQRLDPKIQDLNVSIWHEDPINPKQAGKTYFESRIHHADLFLVLMSNDFLNSKFIRKTEFKTIIDRHKENKSLVVPVILKPCKWDTDLKFIDYVFNLRELTVLPEAQKPVLDWESPEQAYESVAEGLYEAIRTCAEKLSTDPEEENQIALSFSDEEKAAALEEMPAVEELSEEEKHRRWREAEAKRRAEVAKRIKEQAEESARRREEEDKLWEEAMAKRRAEKERRILEEVATSANSGVAEQYYNEEEEEKKRIRERELAAQRRVEERRRKKEASEAKRRAAKEQKIKEAAEEARRRKERKQQNRETSENEESTRQHSPTHSRLENDEAVAEKPLGKASMPNRKLLFGSIILLLVILGVWFFSSTGTDSETPTTTPPTSTTEETIAPQPTEQPQTDGENTAIVLPSLEVGDIYEGGIVFSIENNGKTGIIAHTEDAGLMPWQRAAKIHEQLGEGWRLPTFEELETMYKTIGPGATNRGEFSSELYWSATDYDEFQARLIRFWDGNTSYHYNKHVESRQFQVRPVKDFSR